MKDLTILTKNIFLSIFSINLIPVILIFFLIPITILRRNQILLITFLSFASGGLMADVFLRLFPSIVTYKNSIETHNESHIYHQNNNRTSLVILGSIFLSFFIEKFFRSSQQDEQTMTTSAYLFLFADILYNYTNNWNFSSIFLNNSALKSTVIITKIVSKLLHLFCSYAILIYSGMTSAKAMRFQLLSGFIGSILCLISLEFQSNSSRQFWTNELFSPMIAGIFVYISTVHMISEVIENNSGYKGLFFKVGAFIISVLSIFFLNKYE